MNTSGLQLFGRGTLRDTLERMLGTRSDVSMWPLRALKPIVAVRSRRRAALIGAASLGENPLFHLCFRPTYEPSLGPLAEAVIGDIGHAVANDLLPAPLDPAPEVGDRAWPAWVKRHHIAREAALGFFAQPASRDRYGYVYAKDIPILDVVTTSPQDRQRRFGADDQAHARALLFGFAVQAAVNARGVLPPAPLVVPDADPHTALLWSAVTRLARELGVTQPLETLPMTADAVAQVDLPGRALRVKFAEEEATAYAESVTIDLSRLRTAPLAVERRGAVTAERVHPLVCALAELLADPLPNEAEALRALVAPRHQRLLVVLEEAARVTRAADGEPEEAAKQEQLFWRVVPDRDRLVVAAVVRKPTKRGGLTVGAQLNLDRHAEVTRLAQRPSDQEAIAALRRGASPLPALCGAPNVIDAAGAPVEVRATRAAIRVRPAGDGYAVQVVVGAQPVTPAAFAPTKDAGIVAWDPAARVVQWSALTEPARTVLRAVADVDWVPAADFAAVLDRLHAVEQHAPLELPADLEGEEHEAARITVVRLFEEAPGVMGVRIAARPVPGGALFVPGEGSARPAATVSGRRVVFVRDLDTERAQADAIRDEIAPGVEGLRFALRDDSALVMLAALSDALARGTPPLVVESAAGLMTVTRPAGANDARLRVSRMKDWLHVEGDVTVDGDVVGLEALVAALRAGRKFVPLSGNRFLRLSQELEQRLRTLGDLADNDATTLQLPNESAFALQALADAGADVAGDKAWAAMLRRIASGTQVDDAPPRTLQATLRPYQREGLKFLRRLEAWETGGVLADDMGLGKTLMALAMLLERSSKGPQLVVAPTSVCFNWLQEAARFAPTLKLRPYQGADRAAALTKLKKRDVVVVSYALLTRDAEALAAEHFATAIFDEAHAVKNAGTQRAQAVRGIQADWRFALTGTPLENSTMELWSLFRAVAPGLLGSQDRFRERFAVPIDVKRDPQRKRALARAVQPFLLRRTKAEVAPDLPARTEVTITVDLSEDEQRRYDALRTATVLALAAPVDDSDPDAIRDRRFIALAALTKLRLQACAPALVDPGAPPGSSKIATLAKMVDEVRASGQRALVFSQFVKHLDVIEAELRTAGVSLLRLDGSTPAAARGSIVDSFQAGGADVMLISLKAGGVGLNLTAATYVFHLDPWWNPAVEDQATARAHRIGQQQPVTVYRLVARGTVEEAILKLHADKRDLVDAVLAGSDRAAALSLDDILGILQER